MWSEFTLNQTRCVFLKSLVLYLLLSLFLSFLLLLSFTLPVFVPYPSAQVKRLCLLDISKCFITTRIYCYYYYYYFDKVSVTIATWQCILYVAVWNGILVSILCVDLDGDVIIFYMWECGMGSLYRSFVLA